MPPLRQPLSPDERLARIRSNALRFRSLPRLRLPPDNDLKLAVCGYGPSLADTWQDVKQCDRVMTTSGAHDFLLGKGVIPELHAELDPREHKVAFVRESHASVTYHLAAHCHPKMFARLVSRKRQVVMYYASTKDDTARQAADENQLKREEMDVKRDEIGVKKMEIEDRKHERETNAAMHGEEVGAQNVTQSMNEMVAPVLSQIAQAIAMLAEVQQQNSKCMADVIGQQQTAQCMMQMMGHMDANNAALVQEMRAPRKRELIRGGDGKAMAMVESTMPPTG